MNSHQLLHLIAAATFGLVPVASGSELDQLRARVAEQERQIRLLEQENAQLRADSAPRPTRNLQNSATQVVSSTNQPVARQTASGDTYTVVPGDNLVRIGRQLGVSAQALARANGLETSSIIHPGQKLKVPKGGIPSVSANAKAHQPAPIKHTSHTVQAGETFYRISHQHGIPVDVLMSANPDTQPASLRVGQVIRIPQSSATTSDSQASAGATPQAQPSPETQPAAQPTGNRRQVRTMMIDGDMSYGAFAAKHGTTTERLNQLNGLDLDARTILAKGSELYVPAQP